MKCPNCSTSIHLTITASVDPYPTDEKNKIGFDVAYGFCPECQKMIIVMRTVKYKVNDYHTYVDEVLEQEVIYPEPLSRKCDASEVPDRYKNDFNEASAVLRDSAKASAAISRRTLQDLIRNEFGINKRSLDKEIDEFITRRDIPSYIAQDVDAVRNVGNFAAHPLKDTNTGEIVEVEPGEADWLLDVIEALFDFTFIQPKRAHERREKINDKLTKAGKPPMKQPANK